MQIEERIAKLEVEICALKEDMKELKEMVKGIQEKLNGYLEHRIRITIESMIGRLILALLSSSAVISLLVSWLFR